MGDYDYMPKPDGRHVDSTHETTSDGGGYSFVFYNRNQGQEGRNDKSHRRGISPLDLPSVNIQLSEDALRRLSNTINADGKKFPLPKKPVLIFQKIKPEDILETLGKVHRYIKT